MKKFLAAIICLASAVYSEEGVHPHGYWYGDHVFENHAFDPKLAQELSAFFLDENASSIGDFGCGLGDYLKVFKQSNLQCVGFDGNPDTFALTDGLAQTADLSQPIDLSMQFDWVLSLEVGEHIPKEFESTFIDNLDRHNTKGIILSWALKGQGGYGHFNEQNNNYIKKRLRNLGYLNDIAAENRLRKSSTKWWFRNTIMVFRKVAK